MELLKKEIIEKRPSQPEKVIVTVRLWDTLSRLIKRLHSMLKFIDWDGEWYVFDSTKQVPKAVPCKINLLLERKEANRIKEQYNVNAWN